MTADEERKYHAFNEWSAKEQRRVEREWAATWDGSIAHGEQINDAQCDRIEQAKQRLGIDQALMQRFREWEREHFKATA
jgi:hypothetical protein